MPRSFCRAEQSEGHRAIHLLSKQPRQLQLGYHLYVHENDDRLPPNFVDSPGGVQQSLKGSCVVGNAQRDTNTANIEVGVIFPHIGQTTIYRCPADKSTVERQSRLRRFRTYALCGWACTLGWESTYGVSWDENLPGQGNRKQLSAFPGNSLSVLFAFIDENEKAIDDGMFAIANPFIPPTDSSDHWMELPTDRHNRGCNLSFLDGRRTLALEGSEGFPGLRSGAGERSRQGGFRPASRGAGEGEIGPSIPD